MYDEYDEQYEWDDTCEVCEVGRVYITQKPYITLHQGKFFTVPDATCYACDVCGHIEYDESIHDIIDNMIFGATTHSLAQAADGPEPAPPPKPTAAETGDAEHPKRSNL